MEIFIDKKVQNYYLQHNYKGIVLKKEMQSFGWAGCRDIIQGEFVKNSDLLKENKIKYEEKDIEGIKVFIPKYLNLNNIKEIRITRLFSVFSKVMLLNIELSQI